MATCAHCNGHVVGSAYIDGDGTITHSGCTDARRRAARGLVHECPQCQTHGKVVDRDRPETRTESVPNPDAAWGGNHFMTEEHTVYPHMKTCDLCNGEGYLQKPAVPVVETRQTGWRRG